MLKSSAKQSLEKPAAGGGRLPSRRAAVLLGALAAALLVVTHGREFSGAGPQDCPTADDPARLLETGRAAQVRTPAATPDSIKLVSYNMRWRGGEELREIARLLREDKSLGGAAVVGLQEADRVRRRSGGVNAARLLAEELGMYYAWAAPPCDGRKRDDREAGEDETGVAILSPYPLADVERIVLPHAGPECRRRAALGATVRIGDAALRIFSVHAETRLPVERKVEQWRAVLDALEARRPAPTAAVVLGDFNTIKTKDISSARRLFTGAGFSTPFPDDVPTWRTFLFDLKLDWLWLRGLEAASFGIDKSVDLSDHWPLWAKIKVTSSKLQVQSSPDE